MILLLTGIPDLLYGRSCPFKAPASQEIEFLMKSDLLNNGDPYLQAKTRVAPRFAKSKAASAPNPVFAPVITITYQYFIGNHIDC